MIKSFFKITTLGVFVCCLGLVSHAEEPEAYTIPSEYSGQTESQSYERLIGARTGYVYKEEFMPLPLENNQRYAGCFTISSGRPICEGRLTQYRTDLTGFQAAAFYLCKDKGYEGAVGDFTIYKYSRPQKVWMMRYQMIDDGSWSRQNDESRHTIANVRCYRFEPIG